MTAPDLAVAGVPAEAVEAAGVCSRCKADPQPGICCSAHMLVLCHRCYRRTHFVEVCVAGCRDCAREGLDPIKRPTDTLTGEAEEGT